MSSAVYLKHNLVPRAFSLVVTTTWVLWETRAKTVNCRALLLNGVDLEKLRRSKVILSQGFSTYIQSNSHGTDTYLRRRMRVWGESGFLCLANFTGFFCSFSVLSFFLCVIPAECFLQYLRKYVKFNQENIWPLEITTFVLFS